MKLYLKKMRNIEELEQEKRLLLSERRRLQKEGIDSLPGFLGGKAKKDPTIAKESIGSSPVPGILAMSGPIARLLAGIVRQRITGKKKTSSGGDMIQSVVDRSLKKGKHLLGAAAKEVIVGYLKWKAIELSVKGAALIIRRQKKKKAARAARNVAGRVEA